MKSRYLFTGILIVGYLAFSLDAAQAEPEKVIPGKALGQTETAADPTATPRPKGTKKTKEVILPSGKTQTKKDGLMPGQSRGKPKSWSGAGKKSQGKGLFSKKKPRVDLGKGPPKGKPQGKEDSSKTGKDRVIPDKGKDKLIDQGDGVKKPRRKESKILESERKTTVFFPPRDRARHPGDERVRPRSGQSSDRIPVGYFRIAGGFGGGFWWGGPWSAEKLNAKKVFVDLDSGLETLDIKHAVLDLGLSIQAQLLSHIYVGVRYQHLGVEQESDFPDDFEAVKGRVWRVKALQGTLTLRLNPRKSVQYYVELATGMSQVSWNQFVVAKFLPPQEKPTSISGKGRLHGIAVGVDLYAFPRFGAYMEIRGNVGDFKMDSIVAPQFAGHLVFGAGLVFRL